jgi:hypothetical protein
MWRYAHLLLELIAGRSVSYRRYQRNFMLNQWNNITYLLTGKERQQEAYYTLEKLKMMSILRNYSPTLAGTISLNIDIEGSDLDMSCEVHDRNTFESIVSINFGSQHNFRLKTKIIGGLTSTVINFTSSRFPIEIFAQPKPVNEQNAYLHMDVEARLLAIGGEEARQEVRRLKLMGLKTEPVAIQALPRRGIPCPSKNNRSSASRLSC